jgi:outer membrane protein
MRLNDALERALCVDPSGAKSLADKAAAEATARERHAAFAPSIGYSAGPSANLQLSSARDTDTLRASAQVSLSALIRDGGSRAARLTQAQRDVDQVTHAAALARATVLRDIVGLWADWREAQAGQQAQASALEAAAASLSVAQARFGAGSATGVDVLSAKAQVAQAQRELVIAQASARKAREVLAVRLELPAFSARATDGNEALYLALPMSQPEQFQRALDAHPRVASAQSRMDAADATVAATRADGKPQLRLVANAGPNWSRSNAGSPRGSRSSTSALAGDVSLQISGTFSDGGARDAAIARAQAHADSARASLEEARRNVQNAWVQAQIDWDTALAAVEASEVSVQAAAAAEAAQRGRYSAGVGTIGDVLTAQSNLASRQLQLAQAEQRRLRARAGIIDALGVWDSISINSRPSK